MVAGSVASADHGEPRTTQRVVIEGPNVHVATADEALGGTPVDLSAENPHIRFINRNRGYVRNRVTRSEWTADFRVVDFVTTPGAPVRTRATYLIEDGRPGAVTSP